MERRVEVTTVCNNFFYESGIVERYVSVSINHSYGFPNHPEDSHASGNNSLEYPALPWLYEPTSPSEPPPPLSDTSSSSPSHSSLQVNQGNFSNYDFSVSCDSGIQETSPPGSTILLSSASSSSSLNRAPRFDSGVPSITPTLQTVSFSSATTLLYTPSASPSSSFSASRIQTPHHFPSFSCSTPLPRTSTPVFSPTRCFNLRAGLHDIDIDSSPTPPSSPASPSSSLSTIVLSSSSAAPSSPSTPHTSTRETLSSTPSPTSPPPLHFFTPISPQKYTSPNIPNLPLIHPLPTHVPIPSTSLINVLSCTPSRFNQPVARRNLLKEFQHSSSPPQAVVLLLQHSAGWCFNNTCKDDGYDSLFLAIPDIQQLKEDDDDDDDDDEVSSLALPHLVPITAAVKRRLAPRVSLSPKPAYKHKKFRPSS